MSINLTVPQTPEAIDLNPKITVVGVGGAGGNAINNMINSELGGVEFVVCNTDAQALGQSKAERRVQLGGTLTSGLGAGSRPDVGQAAAEEAMDHIIAELQGSHMAFIAAGMGGGTGTGAAPVVARTAKELGILTVGVVTKPFQFEGSHRMRLAEEGIRELEQHVDTLLIIPNQNLFRIANENTTFADAFKMADDVLKSGVRGVTDLMVMPGLINLDFADIRSVMSEMGKAMMGTGEAEGERRALDAAEAAIANPLLDDSSMQGAKGVLINITGGQDITLFEVDEAANRVRDEVDEDAYIIIGSAFDETMNGTMRVSVVATGIDADQARQPRPTMLKMDDRLTALKPETVTASSPVASPVIREIGELAATLDQQVEDADPVTDTAENQDDILPGADLLDDVLKGEAPETAETADATETAETAEVTETEAETADGDRINAEVVPDSHTGTAPDGAPALGQSDAFIPKPSVTTANTADPGPDAFAAADMLNGAAPVKETEQAEPVKVQKPSLFERVVGLRKSSPAAAPGESSKMASVMPFKVRSEGENPEQTTTDSFIDAAPESPSEIKDARLEPHLGGLDPDDRLKDSDVAEDMLDIPAFLRRQAN